MIKAIEAFPTAGTIDNPEGWIFRIAHNAAPCGQRFLAA